MEMLVSPEVMTDYQLTWAIAEAECAMEQNTEDQGAWYFWQARWQEVMNVIILRAEEYVS